MSLTMTTPRGRSRAVLGVEPLEARDTPATGAAGIVAVGADAGGIPEVRLVDTAGTLRTSFLAYDADFRGGVRVAVGDLTGDGRPEVVTAPGPGGGPLVRVFDSSSGALLNEFFAYDPAFRGGVSVDVGELDGEQVIVTGAGIGGSPHVRAFATGSFAERASFMAYDPGFLGGVNVAVGDVFGDGRGAIVTAPGAGGGPNVRTFTPEGRERTSFFAYAPTFTGGVSVAVGNVANLGRDVIITGAGPGGGPHVRLFDARTSQAIQDIFAYDNNFRGGVTVGVVDGGGDARDTLITAAGPTGGPQVNVYDNYGFGNYGFGYPYFGSSFFAFPAFFTGGLGFGSGFGIYDPLLPVFDPYFGGDWFYDGYDAPLFLTDTIVADPTYFTDPYFLDPGFVDPTFVDHGFVDPGFFDPGYVDPGFGTIDPGYYDYGYSDYGYSDYGYSDYGYGDYGGFDGGGYYFY